MKVVNVQGIVIKTIEYKENSKILNIFTPDYGIIGVISKGCKNFKSPLRSISQNLAYASFNISYKENGLSTLISGDIINYFTKIKSDIISLSYLTYLTELASLVYKESNKKEIYDLLIESLNKIESGLNPKIISNILEFKYLEYLGIDINVDNCRVCGTNKIITFSFKLGGFVCDECRNDEAIIDEKIIKMLRMYKYVDISKISKIDISESVVKKIDMILDEYYNEYSGIYIKSKDFIKSLEKY